MQTLFLTENLALGGHSEDILSCVGVASDRITSINFRTLFLEYGKNVLLQRLKLVIQAERVSLIVVNLGTSGILSPHELNQLKSINSSYLVIIFGDSEHNFELHDRYYAQVADLNWLLCPSARYHYELYGFPHFCQQPFGEVNYPYIPVKKVFDVSFVGGLDRGKRDVYISALRACNRINVNIAGYGTERGLVNLEEKNYIISSSRIHLNFTEVVNPSKRIFHLLRQTKGRPLECGILGTFVLSEFSPGLDEILPAGCYDTFNSPAEMMEKIEYYLHNSERREACVTKARSYCQKYYAKNVAQTLTEQISKHPSTDAEKIFIDLDFRDFLTSHSYYYFWRFVFRGRPLRALGVLRFSRDYFTVNMCMFIFQFVRAAFHGIFR